MTRILELRLWNFRAFRWAFLPLSDLTVLVGPNGSGKSTIAQALTIISQGLTEGLEAALVQADGAFNLVSKPRSRPETRMGLAVKLEVYGVLWIYGFVLELRGENDYRIVEERLTPLDNDTAQGFWRNSFGETLLIEGGRIGARSMEKPLAATAVPYLAFPIIATRSPIWLPVIENLRAMHSYQLIPEQIRVPHTAGSTTVPLARDGSNAADVFQNIRGGAGHRWIVEHLAYTTRNVEDVRPQTVLSMRSLSIVQRINGGTVEFAGHALSEGTMRMLGALLALRQEPRPSLVFLDEVDADLHPPVLGVLLSAIESCLDVTQVVIASHSTEALSHESVTAERTRILQWTDGQSSIHPVHDAVKDLLIPPETIGRLLSVHALDAGDPAYMLEGADDLNRQRNFLETG